MRRSRLQLALTSTTRGQLTLPGDLDSTEILASTSSLALSSRLRYFFVRLKFLSFSWSVRSSDEIPSSSNFANRYSRSTSALSRLASPSVFTLGIDRRKASKCRVDDCAVMEVGVGSVFERTGEFVRESFDWFGKLESADRNLSTCFLGVSAVCLVAQHGRG